MSSINLLLVVDGWFTLGDRDMNDRSFSISHLIKSLKASTDPKIKLTTAHRDGDYHADIRQPFKFDDFDLGTYDEIWMFGYNGYNPMDPKNGETHDHIEEDELLRITDFMEGGGGILASGDHEGVGSYMCGLIPRVRTMRKWFGRTTVDPKTPKGAPLNWPIKGEDRADTLQMGEDKRFLFENQSDDIPQKLTIIPLPEIGIHPILQLGPPVGKESRVLEHFPDHFHEGEVLGYGGVEREDSQPWTTTDKVKIKKFEYIEYPTKDGHQEKPMIIATGEVHGGHKTYAERPTICDSGFVADTTLTKAKRINTLSVYDGRRVDVGRIITDSSFHHFTDLNLIGDPCAKSPVRSTGLNKNMLDDLSIFYINVAKWLARP